VRTERIIGELERLAVDPGVSDEDRRYMVVELLPVARALLADIHTRRRHLRIVDKGGDR
jgi:hypothetical protein